MRFSDGSAFLNRRRCGLFYWLQMCALCLLTAYLAFQLYPPNICCWNPEETAETIGEWVGTITKVCFWTFMIGGIGYWAYEHYSGKFDEDKDKKKKDKNKKDDGGDSGSGVSLSTNGKNVVSSPGGNLKRSGSNFYEAFERFCVKYPRFQRLIDFIYHIIAFVFLCCVVSQVWPQTTYCLEGSNTQWTIFWTVMVVSLAFACRCVLWLHEEAVEEAEKKRAAFEQQKNEESFYNSVQDYTTSPDILTSEELALYCKTHGVTIPPIPVYEYDPTAFVVPPLPTWLLKINEFLDYIVQLFIFVAQLWSADSYGCLFWLWYSCLISCLFLGYVVPELARRFIWSAICHYSWLPGFYSSLDRFWYELCWWQNKLFDYTFSGFLFFGSFHIFWLYTYYFPS